MTDQRLKEVRELKAEHERNAYLAGSRSSLLIAIGELLDFIDTLTWCLDRLAPSPTGQTFSSTSDLDTPNVAAVVTG